MGAKTWMLVYAKADVAEALKRSPQLDRDATLQLATSLFPKDKLDAIGEGDRHPLELGEAALKEFFGYQLEGFIDPTLLEPESIPLVKYKRKRSG